MNPGRFNGLVSGTHLAADEGILLLSPVYGPLPVVVEDVIRANVTDVERVTFVACIEPVIGQVRALLP